jgi:hypothetical protein
MLPRLLLLLPPIVRVPVLNTEPLLKDSVAVPVAPGARLRAEQAAESVSTVTVIPAPMLTVSADPGTTPPVQVLALLQLPDVAADIVAAIAGRAGINIPPSTSAAANAIKMILILVFIKWFVRHTQALSSELRLISR